MQQLSNKAFAVLAYCEETKRPFGITVDQINEHKYSFMWAFPIDKDKAHREGFDVKNVTGEVEIDDEYPGCPHCGSKRFWMCVCGHPICYHGQEHLHCPNCGADGTIQKVKQVNLRGGGY